jgi:peptidoglycan/LPS O-acetylase OafA/YrhL
MLELQTSHDYLRWLVLAQGAFLVGFSIAVMVEARKFRAPPRHVVAIAISYMILTVVVAEEVYERFGDPLSWRTLVALAAYSFGLYSQWMMYRAYHYAARLRRHEQIAVKEGNRIMAEVFKRSHDDGDRGES